MEENSNTGVSRKRHPAPAHASLASGGDDDAPECRGEVRAARREAAGTGAAGGCCPVAVL